MDPFDVPDVDSLLALSSLISQQVDQYAGMARDYQRAPEKQSFQQRQTMREQAQLVAKTSARLQASISEPGQWMAQTAWSYCDSVALSLSLEMRLPEHIEPGEKGTTLGRLTTCTGYSPALIKRIMRLCINRCIFKEMEPGCYQHNRHSLLLRGGNFGSLIHYLVDDGLLCGAYLARTMARDKFQIRPDPKDAAFCAAFQTKLPLYEYYHTVDTDRGQRFSRAMAGHYDGPLDQPVESMFPFNITTSSLLVDVGGGNGQQAIRLASRYPQLSCVVQDHANVVVAAEEAAVLPQAVAGRITWEPHDFYKTQPRRGAAFYLLSHVLMDNHDTKCKEMLGAVVEAMSSSSRLLVHDFVDPPTFGDHRPGILDMLDLHMIASLNTHSRSEAQWDEIIRGVDPRLVRQQTWFGQNGSAVLELRLKDGGDA